MPTLINKWKRNTLSTQYPYTRPNLKGCRSAKCINLNINARKSNKTPAEPRKPSSSPTVQKMKSVSCSGTNFNFVCVPFKKPLPCKPPEPMAISL